MTDKQTLAVYDAKIEDYKNLTAAQPGFALRQFIAALPANGTALDLGCGPGFAAAEMALKGLRVTATDASPEMANAAGQHQGVIARCEDFSAIPTTPTYDGIYANFSLLHGRKADFTGYITACHAALNPNGYLHLGLKQGTGEERDAIGRFYSYYMPDELHDILSQAGFTVAWKTEGEEVGMAGSMDPFILIQARKI
ncbi:MAG: class I SAM-dependent DNA methyltransferase [Planktomarina sp.]